MVEMKVEKAVLCLGASRSPSRSVGHPSRVHGNHRQLHNSRGIPAQHTPIV